VRRIGGKTRRDMAELRRKVLVEEQDVHRGRPSSAYAEPDPDPSIADKRHRDGSGSIGSQADMAWPPRVGSSC
jgi:hypothetical protein